jgi:hypothetical protein
VREPKKTRARRRRLTHRRKTFDSARPRTSQRRTTAPTLTPAGDSDQSKGFPPIHCSTNDFEHLRTAADITVTSMNHCRNKASLQTAYRFHCPARCRERLALRVDVCREFR